MNARRVCLDLTTTETHDRYGGFTRGGLALLDALLALSPADRQGIELFAVARSEGPVLPAARVRADAIMSGPLVGPERHARQRRALGHVLSASRIDLFHSLYPEALPRRVGFKVVANVNDLVTDIVPMTGNGFVKRLGRRLERWWEFRAADHLVAISETTRADARRVARVPSRRIDVVHLGVDTGRFRAVPGAGLPSEVPLPARYFLTVGSDHYRKNQWRLFEAWLHAADRIPEGLVLVGRQIYGDVLSGIAAEARARGLADRVVWMGDRDDEHLEALYRGATALVAPSLYEGFGMTLLEAMACGAPVIASTAPAHREVSGDAAVFFDPLSVSDMTAALVRLSADVGLREDLRAKGRERVRQFTWERCAREMLAIYRKLLGLS